MKNTINIIKFLNIIQSKQETLKFLKDDGDPRHIDVVNDLEIKIQDFWNLVGIYAINNNEKDFLEASEKINSIINYKEPIDELELNN